MTRDNYLDTYTEVLSFYLIIRKSVFLSFILWNGSSSKESFLRLWRWHVDIVPNDYVGTMCDRVIIVV